MPLISVITPAYNSEKTIRNTIVSVLNQSFSDFEYIIIDDGSTDDTAKIIHEFHDKRIRYIYQTNAERAYARNKAISNAQGEFVAFLDADDLWLPSKLSNQVQLFQQNMKLGLVYSDVNYFSGLSGDTIFRFGDRIKLKRGMIWKDMIWSGNLIQSPTPLIRKDVFSVIGIFDPELVPLEDWDMWLRITKRYPVDYVDEPLSMYRLHSKSISIATPDDDLLKCYFRLLDKVLLDTTIDMRIKISFLRMQVLNGSAIACRNKGQYREAQNLLRQAIREFPLFPSTYYRLIQTIILEGFRGYA